MQPMDIYISYCSVSHSDRGYNGIAWVKGKMIEHYIEREEALILLEEETESPSPKDAILNKITSYTDEGKNKTYSTPRKAGEFIIVPMNRITTKKIVT